MSDIKLRLDGENEDVELKPVEYKEKIQIDQSIKFSPFLNTELELKKRFQISQKKL